jgi:hypothetical protein
MQFEGHSTAVADIVVDAVGKYAYTISSPHTDELPVIMDVALEERTKVHGCISPCTLFGSNTRSIFSHKPASSCSSKVRSVSLQVLTVHSNVRIENHTSHALQVRNGSHVCCLEIFLRCICDS